MSYTRRAWFLAASGLIMGAGTARAADDPTHSLLGSISTARAKVRTLIADFSQERALGLLATEVKSKGRVTLVRPHLLRWELFAPDTITYWVGPAGLAYVSPSSRGKVDRDTAGPLGAVLTDLLVVLGGDLRTLTKRYGLRADRLPKGGVRVVAVPKAARLRKSIRRFEVDLEPDLVAPRQVLLQESDTDRVRIRFRDVRRNVRVDQAIMRPPTR